MSLISDIRSAFADLERTKTPAALNRLRPTMPGLSITLDKLAAAEHMDTALERAAAVADRLTERGHSNRREAELIALGWATCGRSHALTMDDMLRLSMGELDALAGEEMGERQGQADRRLRVALVSGDRQSIMAALIAGGTLAAVEIVGPLN